MLAPIVLFVYARPEHTRRTIEFLSRNDLADESELFIYSDAPRHEDHIDSVKEVRDYIRGISGFKRITIFERKRNWGLADSIIDGVTHVVNKYGKAIVLEDDMIVSPCFLKYMNEALEEYQDNAKVACIHGYVPYAKGLPKYFFLKGADCWGWATWSRAWSVFEKDENVLLDMLNQYGRKNDKLGQVCGFPEMLDDQIKGKVNSWAIRWYYSAFFKDMYCLHPGKTLVINIGQDGSGTHGAYSDEFQHEEIINSKIDFEVVEVEENLKAKQILIDYYTGKKPAIPTRIKNRLLKLLKVF